MARKFFVGVFFILVVIALYLVAWPVPISPAAWTPPAAPTDQYPANKKLAQTERLGEVEDFIGPEDVAVDSQGRLYAGVEDGRILRLQADGGTPELFADTGGRPLGLDFDQHGNLIVADAIKGLLSIGPDGKLTLLTAEHNAKPFVFTDDVEVGSDGIIYFTDASSKFPISHYMLDILEHRGHGRLLSFDPSTKKTRLLLDGLYFANGVAVSPKADYVLVNETTKYRIQRYWLRGPKQGQAEIFIDNLPGFPDGLSSNGQGTYWLALMAPRNPDLDAMLPKPFLRKLTMRLPAALRPAPRCHAWVLGLNSAGQVVHDLQDPDCEKFGYITSVQQYKDDLYLGSLILPAIGRIPAPK